VLSSLAHWEPGAVAAPAVAVGLAKPSELAQGLHYLVDVLEHPEVSGP